MLRIIAGELGGRRLRTPSGRRTRPTSDRVREALFSILESAAPLHGATVLDLYAGSGALGIEALSRGAARAVFVEQDAIAARTLLSNLRDLGMAGERGQVVARPVRAALSQRFVQEPFDFIFADPPYASDELPWLLERLSQPAALALHGCLVVERASRDADAIERAATLNRATPLTLVDRRRYGDTSLLFYRNVGGAS